MTKIFCQNCYSTTHAIAASVWDVNTNGTCSKCGSEAILSPEVVAGAINAPPGRTESTSSEDNWIHSPQGGRGKRMLEYNHSFVHNTDIRALLEANDFRIARWWDGHYFQLNYNFLYIRNGDCYSPTLDILLENKDGSQEYITFEVTLKKLHPVDSEQFSANAQKIEP